MRQVFRAGIGEQPQDIKRAQIINFDIGIGDPITPGPVKAKTEELIGNGELSWQVYPVETIIAEKLQTLIARGSDNSRAKDVFDLYYYLPKANSKSLKEAIAKCFEFRKTPFPRDPVEILTKIDQTLLKRGWKKAMSSLDDPPSFENVFNGVLEQLELIFRSKWTKK